MSERRSLLAPFFRAINHQLRNPLSTIVNELSYLRSLLPEVEIERAQKASRRIIETLDEIERTLRNPLTTQLMSGDEIVAVLEQRGFLCTAAISDGQDKFTLPIDALSGVLAVLQSLVSEELQLDLHVQRSILTIETRLRPKCGDGLSDQNQQLYTLSEFWEGVLGLSEPMICILEEVFSECAFRVSLHRISHGIFSFKCSAGACA